MRGATCDALSKKASAPSAVAQGVITVMSCCQQVPNFLRRQGFGEVVALGYIAAHLPQPLELLLFLYPLGDSLDAQGMRQVDYRRYQHLRPRIFAEPADERTIDLDVLYGEALEVGERGVPCPEIVQDRPHAEILKLL